MSADDTGRRAWDRRPGETDRAWAAFNAYLRLGPERTLADAAEAIGRPRGYRETLKYWSVKYDWRIRAAAWDEHVEARVNDARTDELEQAARRQARIAEAALGLVASTIKGYYQREEARQAEVQRLQSIGSPVDPSLLTPTLRPTDVARLLDVAVRTQRLALGAATDRIEVTGEDAVRAAAQRASDALGVDLTGLL